MKYIKLFEAKKEYKYNKIINVKEFLSFAYKNLPKEEFLLFLNEIFTGKSLSMYCDGSCNKRIQIKVVGFQFHDSFMSTGRPTIGLYNRLNHFHFIDLDSWLKPHEIIIFSDEPFEIGKYEKKVLFLLDAKKYNL